MYYNPLILLYLICKYNDMKRTVITTIGVFASAILLLGSAVVFGPANRAAYAHTFSGNENAAFLTMVQQIKVETSLAGNNTSDKEIADHHMEHAAEALTNATLKEIAERNKRIATDLPASIEQLKTTIDSGNATANDIQDQVQAVSDLLDEATQVRIESTQVSNSTVQALVVANLVNEALEHYGEAVGFEGNMTDMSAMTQQHMNNTNTTSPTKIVSEANYQSALAFAQKAQELYQQQIKDKALPGKENAVKALDEAFSAFVKAIKNKASAMEVMNIGHVRVHPNLIAAYNLQLAA